MFSSRQQSARLTKKQKKATAFRERGSKSKGKGKGNDTTGNPVPGRSGSRPLTTTGDNGEGGYDDEDANAIPAMEDQDQALAAMAGDTEGVPKGHHDSALGRRVVRGPKKTAVESTSTAMPNKRKRRSRAEELGDSGAQLGPGPKKKARLAHSTGGIIPPAAHDDEDDVASMNDDDDDGDESKTKSKGSKAMRYILFIGNVLSLALTIDRAEWLALIKGNLKYTTTREAIQNHFSLCSAFSPLSLPFNASLTPYIHAAVPLTLTNVDPPPTVRLLTPKVARPGATVIAKSKSKGCAFLEFSTRHALQVALRLHQSELDGRRINVELTAGGGGKSDARLAKVKARNKHLAVQRVRPFVSISFIISLACHTHSRIDGCLIDTAAQGGDDTRKA